ncbi:LCP family protein [Streptomyces sp. NPDC055078]
MGQNRVREEGARDRVHRSHRSGHTARSSATPLEVNANGHGRSARSGSGTGSGSGSGSRRPGASRRRGKRGKRGKRRILRWIAISLAVLVLGTAGAAYLYIQHLNGNIRSGKRSSGDSGVEKAKPNAAGQTPLNILIIGSDSRNTDANLALGGSRDTVGSKPRADVQMLLHVSADRESASVISIPRDTRVNIPECRDAKTGQTAPAVNTIINESLARGGPGCTLTTWEKLTGIYIDHWMMVDFAGVVKMADAVGGVEVCVKHNVHDRPTRLVKGGSGLKLKKGPNTIRGKQALQWLRTRHAFYNDQGRAKAQHMYMNSMMRELKSQNAFTDTGRIMDLAEAGTKALQVSEELGSVNRLFDLAMELKNVPTNRITMSTLPTAEYPGNRNQLVAVDQEADRLWQMLRDDIPFDKNGKNDKGGKGGRPGGDEKKPAAGPKGPAAAAPDTLGLVVVNGTAGNNEGPVPGRAGAVTDTLHTKGFTRAETSRNVNPLKESRLAYPEDGGPQARADALSVATAVGLPTTAVRPSADVDRLTLTVGADWRTGTLYPKKAPPTAGDLPDSANAINGSDSKACMDVYEPYRW